MCTHVKIDIHIQLCEVKKLAPKALHEEQLGRMQHTHLKLLSPNLLRLLSIGLKNFFLRVFIKTSVYC